MTAADSKCLDFSIFSPKNVEFCSFIRRVSDFLFSFIFPSSDPCPGDALLLGVFYCLEKYSFLLFLKFAKQRDVHVTDIFGLCKLS